MFIAALLGGIIGFLWYNTYPAQIFMGDTGSLTLGGIIAVIAILVRKELLLPILCGIFSRKLICNYTSTYFKYTKENLEMVLEFFNDTNSSSFSKLDTMK